MYSSRDQKTATTSLILRPAHKSKQSETLYYTTHTISILIVFEPRQIRGFFFAKPATFVRTYLFIYFQHSERLFKNAKLVSLSTGWPLFDGVFLKVANHKNGREKMSVEFAEFASKW